MLRVLSRGLKRNLAGIHILVCGAIGDPIIFYPGESALVGRRKVGFDVIQVQIESNITVEIAIARITRITSIAAPDLPRRISVAAKSRHSHRSKDRSENSVPRLRLRV